MTLFLENMDESLLGINTDFNKVVLGDFNVDFTSGEGKNANLSLKRKLQGISRLYDLKQMIQSATRITENSKSLIDLVFTNVKEKIIEVRLFDPGLSDHSLVYCILKCGGLCSSQDNRISLLQEL